MSDVINFEEIDEHGPQTCHGRYDVPLSELDRDEVAGNASVEIEARVEQGGSPGEYVAEGQSKIVLDLNCSRCLEPFPFANSSKFHVRFRPRPEVSEENEEIQIAGEEELDVEFYAEHAVPLRHLAVEQIQLVIPMKPLCEESCLGLCPKCGANRSHEPCECDLSVTDDRWDALRGIRQNLAKKKDI